MSNGRRDLAARLPTPQLLIRVVGGLGNCHELVEHGVISEDAFCDMVFTNAIEFWTSENRDFFNGTAVQAAADSLLPTAAGNTQ